MKLSSFHIELSRDLIWRVFIFLCMVNVMIVASDVALAAAPAAAGGATGGNDIIGHTLCRLVNSLNGGIARGIATLAIFGAGVGMFTGKMNMQTMGLIAVGVGVVFGAPKLVGFLSGDASHSNCPTA